MLLLWLRRLVPLTCAILLAVAVSGCGQKGPLYLPSNPGTSSPSAGS
ncbi:LPS translocon maturation chaperone LptM [Acidihalobacter yilgarnensis]